ncbi:hypothetical protein KM043_016681 [Ampulex compressa]|nr:hypothetical protein KM043_016681 [Ampulex compressa]
MGRVCISLAIRARKDIAGDTEYIAMGPAGLSTGRHRQHTNAVLGFRTIPAEGHGGATVRHEPRGRVQRGPKRWREKREREAEEPG